MNWNQKLHQVKQSITRYHNGFNNFQRQLKVQLVIACAATISVTAPVQAVQFNFKYAPGTTLEQKIGFEMAGRYWANYLADDVTINIFVETTNMLPENVIGGALPGILTQQEYQTFRQHYSADITSIEDQIAFDNLYTGITGTRFGLSVNNNLVFNQTLNLTRASAKALGIIDGNDSKLDGYILMSDLTNESVSWNYDPLNNVPDATLDFFSVAVHEIGHTLGFVSGVDNPNWIDTLRGLQGANWMDYLYLTDNIDSITLLDMFRRNGEENESLMDISSGGNPFFSIDGGITNLADFASGEDTNLGGDGYQASHWQQQGNHLGIMDPILGTGQRRQITDLDKLAIDVLGWDLQQGGNDLATIYNQVMEEMEANPTVTPFWIDENNNNLDDRGELLNEMVLNSQTYNWGWEGFWWGWEGFWWGWEGFWQQQEQFSEAGFWQNLSWQTVNMSNTSESQSVPESSCAIGLLGLGLVGICSFLKKHTKQ